MCFICPVDQSVCEQRWVELNPDGVGVGVGDVSDPALRRAGLDGRQAEEADLQPGDGELRQLEAQTDRTDLQHGGRAETGDLQLETGAEHIVRNESGWADE